MKCSSCAVLLAALVTAIAIEKGTALESLKEFNVSITVNYTPPLDFDRSSPYYRAASPLSLTCEVEGTNGEVEGVFYEWRSTCVGNCFAARQTTKTVQTAYLHSYDTGLHTCIIYDGLGCSGNASAYVNVVGAGIYVSGGQKALPNNGLIVAGVDDRISEFRCLSGSSSQDVGQLINPDGDDITFLDSDHFLVRKGGSYDPGLVHVRRAVPLRREEEGVYTCRIPDEKGETVDVNVGLYLKESAAPPVVVSVEYGQTAEELYTLTCTSSGSPPTSVTWTRNGVTITADDDQYKATQQLVNRTETIYNNLLTISGSFEDAIGDYSCSVENSIGASNMVNRTIKALEISGHETPVIVGLTGSINCSTLLNVSKMEWYIKGFDDPVESGVDVNSLLLTLNPDNTALNGTSVICQATAASGEVYEEKVLIMVKELENTIKFEGPENPLLAGGSYSLTCVVTADLLPEVKWRDGEGNDVLHEANENGGMLVEEEVNGHVTRLTLRFPSLLASHGGTYSCLSIIAAPSSIQISTRDVIVKIPPPVVKIAHQPESTQLFTTDSLDLICLSNVNLAVDVPVQVNISWLGPLRGAISTDSRVSILGVEGAMLEYDSTLRFSSLRSTDSGTYTCSSIATPKRASRYILSSNSVSTVSSVNAALKTTIVVSYTPPDQYPDYAPPNYRAASSVTLRCSTEGASGSVSYRWSSTCSSCFASSSTSASITENMLRSRDGGDHTCTATDSVGNTGNSSTTMNIVGAGVYVTRSVSYIGGQAAQPNDSYIVVDSGSHRWSDYIRLKLYCCSNATSSSVGSFTLPNGVTLTSNYDSFRISQFSAGNSYAGCIYMDIYYYEQREHCRYTYDWRGYRRYRCDTVTDTNFVLENSQTGVYSCNIPDAWGTTQNVHFALYSEGSHSISITGLQQKASTSAPSLSCLTRGVPPTEVSWQKNDQEMILNDNTTEMVKSITNRYSSSYSTSVSLYSDIETVIGNYTCKAGNRYGTTTSQTLIIKGIETNITSNSLVVGNNIEFNCSSDLDPQTITWYRDGSTVANASGSYKELYIDPVSTDDQGVTYSCTVISPYGSQERNATLSVTVPDNWATVITSVRVPHRYQNPHHGDNYTIDCRVHIIDGMNIAPVIQWYYPNGSAVLESGKRVTVGSLQSHSSGVKTTSLTFSPVESDDGGEYSCRAQVTVPWMTEQPRVHSASVNLVVRTKAKFQLKLGPLPHCSTWDMESASYYRSLTTAHHLQRSIKAAIEEAVQSRCDCDFYSSAITSGEFSCQTTTSDVVYRAVINGRSDLITANETLDYIDDWRRNEQTILHNLFRLRLSQDCPLRIDSFNEVECKTSDEDNGSEVKCDKAGNSCVDGRHSDKKGLLLGSGACYKFEACDSDSGGGVSSGDDDFLEGDKLVSK